MIILKAIKNWSNAITETLGSIILLIFLLELLLGKAFIEFISTFNVSEQIIFITNQLSLSNSSTAIVFIYILYKIYSR
mgnify:FL=1|jgi:hypothetical protein